MDTLEYGMENIFRYVGCDMGCSDWITVDQRRIDQFAECTGDHQWIHTDPVRAARETPFGGTIAHGYLSLSLVASTIMQVGVIPRDVASVLNYGLDKVRFINPVRSGQRVRNRVKLISAEPQGEGKLLLKLSCTIDIEADPKPALVAEALCLLIGKKEEL